MLALLLALAVALRLVAPAGWMPSFDARGMSLELCNGTEIMVHVGRASTHAHDHHDEKAPNGQPCPYAVASVPTTLAASIAVDLPPALVSAPAAAIAPIKIRIDGLVSPPPPATGPPFFA